MILLDTNVLARLLEPRLPHHRPSVESILVLHGGGEELCICAQNIVELYAISTRNTNGLGLSPARALAEIGALKAQFSVLADEALHAKWEELIAKYHVTNRLVFDLRLIAAAIVGGCSAVLTFNDADFKRFSEVGALNPFDLLGVPRI